MADDPKPCWLVWEQATDGGRPYLVAVDSTPEQAATHRKAIEDWAELEGRFVLVRVEPSLMDHLYGESMTKLFDRLKGLRR